MAQTFRPLHDGVLILPHTQANMTAGGLYKVDSKEKPTRGDVVAVGPGRIDLHGLRVPMSVEVGDLVLYSRYERDEVEVEGVTHMIVAESEIKGVFEGDARKVEPLRWEAPEDRLLKALPVGSAFTHGILDGLFASYRVVDRNESMVVVRAESFEGASYDLVGKAQEGDPDSFEIVALALAPEGAEDPPTPVNPYAAEREEAIDRVLHRFDGEAPATEFPQEPGQDALWGQRSVVCANGVPIDHETTAEGQVTIDGLPQVDDDGRVAPIRRDDGENLAERCL